jgi:hypothetical protein
MERELTDEELEHYMPWSFRRYPKKLKRKYYALPRISEAVLEHGITAHNSERFNLIFESVNSDMSQGVHLITDKAVIVDGKTYKRGVTIFFDIEQQAEYEARPKSSHKESVFDKERKEHIVDCQTKEGLLWIWNVWMQYFQGVRIVLSHEKYCGMLVEELPNGYRYRCNEGRDDDDYDDLIFRIERTESSAPSR